ncbi:MAG: hypothetical protein KIT86_23955 [Hydrogenophaga sp.]|uniref:hypothetical protein n=1 Tax=Hydrogenophaga sp. TaxID=1904254 RepID=UPI0026257689|nr:hypothetical protein [Hydrogenophaga sp.]MCW5672723.1 hypothetical protein [Hydrogenophaga sp.]
MKLVEQADPSKRSKELATVMTSAARMLGVGDVSELEEVAQYVPDLTKKLLKQLDGNLRNLPDVLRNLRTLARAPARMLILPRLARIMSLAAVAPAPLQANNCHSPRRHLRHTASLCRHR